MSRGAAARGLEHAKTGEAVARLHRRRRAVADPGRHGLVELQVGARVERHLLAPIGRHELAGRGEREAGVAGAHTLLKLSLLRIEPVAGEPGESAADPEAR